jgi:hypothetical protein
MTIQSILKAISESSLSLYLQESAWGFPIVESVHVIAITLVFGTILIADLRLVGMASRSRAVSDVLRDTLKLTWVAFIFAVITGSLLFSTSPETYFYNTEFRYKMLCLALAGVNMLIFERVTAKSIPIWDIDRPAPVAAKLAGGLSILLWTCVLVLGRWVGFTIQ